MVSSPDEDGSSSDMNDDDLVASYIAPPASPAASPRATHPSAGSRRRSGGSRGTRGTRVAAAGTGTVAATASAAVGVGEIGQHAAERDEILRAVRNGFSSVRRELTRFRAELVVVKSQAASTLRRMDGLAAAADSSEAGSGALCERMGEVEKAVTSLGDRLPAAQRGVADGTSDAGQSVCVITEIKVCSHIALVLLLFVSFALVLCI